MLIGPNDTGKTNFLEAVYSLAESTRNSPSECFWSPWQNRELVHNGTPDTPVRFTAELGSLGDHGGHANADEGLAYSLALTFAGERDCRVYSEKLGSAVEGMRELAVESKCRRPENGGSRAPRRSRSTDQGSAAGCSAGVAKALPAAALARWDVEELATPSRLSENRKYPFDPSGYGLATCTCRDKAEGRGGHFAAAHG